MNRFVRFSVRHLQENLAINGLIKLNDLLLMMHISLSLCACSFILDYLCIVGSNKPKRISDASLCSSINIIPRSKWK